MLLIDVRLEKQWDLIADIPHHLLLVRIYVYLSTCITVLEFSQMDFFLMLSLKTEAFHL